MIRKRFAPVAALAGTLLLAACGGADAPAPAAEAAPAAAVQPEPARAQLASATDAEAPLLTVYRTPSCGCCKAWAAYMEREGFRVQTVEQPDLAGIKRQLGVPQGLHSCHTATVGGYTVEGHVPADVVRRLLAEKPPVKGIAVPGMPMGSPGMEGMRSEPYEVYTFDESGPVAMYEAR